MQVNLEHSYAWRRGSDTRCSVLSWADRVVWTGDVFTSTLGATAISWRMRFDDEVTVVRLATALARVPGISIQSQRKHKELEVRASDDARMLEAWASPDPDHCPMAPP
jgi:hypothetical protein